MKITLIIGADDWQGLYIDNKLVYENHYIYARNILQNINRDYVNFIETEIREFDMERYNLSRLPETLEELERVESDYYRELGK